MAATEWQVINESRFLGAYVVDGTLDGWFLNHAWPIAETPLSKWLMDQVGYIKPPEPVKDWPRPTHGQGWPIWSNAPALVGASTISIVRMTQAEYEALLVKDASTMYVLEG